MKLYYAGAENNLKLFKKLNIDSLLMAYPFIKKKSLKIDRNWFIDCGAYSAYTKKLKINIDEYLMFIFKNNLKIYASLDVIGNAELSYKNYLYMKKKKAKRQIPAFHYGEDVKYLKLYLEECDYIAIGGVAQLKSNQNKLKKFLDSCYNEIAKKKKVKVHGYGLNNWKLLLKYPFYSVDATSWLNPNIYGQHFKFEQGKLKRISNDKKIINKFYKNEDRLIASLKEFKKAEKYLTKLWEKRGVIWKHR
tara:strand:+ start:204 stop:947 length:744 start_codon:yes stop_codon:yes gene_type:complete